MFTDGKGLLYIGDMRPGDRKATDQEVTDWQSLRFAVIAPLSPADRFTARTGLTVGDLKQMLGLS